MSVRLTYFVSHPIQYQAPLLRKIAADPDIDLEVCFEHLDSLAAYHDGGFGATIEWDVPLIEGYSWRSARDLDLGRMLADSDAIWVHGWQSKFLRRVIASAERQGTPVLMRGETWDGALPDGPGPLGIMRRLYHRHILSKCSGFLAIGSGNRRFYLERGVPAERIFDMPYAVDNERFAAAADASDRAAVRRRLGIGEDEKIILYAGKLIRRKRPDLLLEAWQSADWGGEPPRLVFVGDGELRGHLQEVAPASVIFAGFINQTELPGIYDVADAFVLAAEKEPWGLAINEAMACGTAVIASDQCGAALDLVDPSTGAVVRAGDVEQLAATLPAVLANSGELGRVAKERVFGWGFDEDLSGLKRGLDVVIQ